MVRSQGPRVALASACALVVAMPFEPLRSLAVAPWQRVSLVEMVMAVGAAAWAMTISAARARAVWRSPFVWPWLLLLTVLTCSAAMAPAYHLAAFKVTTRLLAALVMAVMAADAASNERAMRWIMTAAVGAGVVVAAAAVLEYVGAPVILAWLNGFRDGVRVVGGQVRATGTLQYPTIAAMYFEIVFAFGLGVLLWMWDVRPRRHPRIVVLVVALLVIAEAVVLTFTRAALLGVTASLAVVAVRRVRRMGMDGGVRLAAALLATVWILPLVSWPRDAGALRLSSEGREGWYRAAFVASPPAVMAASDVVQLDVLVTNTGRLTWRRDADPPFRASYHWFDAASDRVVQYDGARTDLPGDVAPGASVQLPLSVRTPSTPGRYRLAWDMVQEHRLWFSTERGAALTWAVVAVEPSTRPAHPFNTGRQPRVIPQPTEVLGRWTLWRAAVSMWRDHPVLGVGLDNFRQLYGPYTGRPAVDPNVHSNNMYLEWLTGGGVVGAAAFVWLVARAWRTSRAVDRALPAPAASLYVGAAAAGAAVLVHGVLDSFLTFTPTYVACAVMLGLIAAPWHWTEVQCAHRI